MSSLSKHVKQIKNNNGLQFQMQSSEIGFDLHFEYENDKKMSFFKISGRMDHILQFWVMNLHSMSWPTRGIT